MNFKNIIFDLDIESGIATIIFNRPESLNAFSYELVNEFCLVLEHIITNKLIKCVIISGKEKSFSVGGDIHEFSNAEDKVMFMSKMADKLHDGIKLLKNLEVPTIAAINGSCFGAALGYVCACELRFCTENAKFGTAFTGIGLSTDSSTSFYLPKIVGLSLASEMIYLNRILNSEEALSFGLVSSIFPSNENFLEKLKIIGAQLSHGPIVAFKNVKKLLNGCYINDLSTHLLKEAEKITECAGTLDFKEGISAFLEKRKANYRGK